MSHYQTVALTSLLPCKKISRPAVQRSLPSTHGISSPSTNMTWPRCHCCCTLTNDPKSQTLTLAPVPGPYAVNRILRASCKSLIAACSRFHAHSPGMWYTKVVQKYHLEWHFLKCHTQTIKRNAVGDLWSLLFWQSSHNSLDDHLGQKSVRQPSEIWKWDDQWDFIRQYLKPLNITSDLCQIPWMKIWVHA